MRFARYTARRLLLLPVQLLLVSLIVFFLVRQMPGEPTFLYTGPFATHERVAEVRRQLGLDQPIHVQYARYLQRVVRGDFGMSLRTSQPVMADIRQRLPATMELILLAVVFSVLIGVPLGVYTAIRRRGSSTAWCSCTECWPAHSRTSGSPSSRSSSSSSSLACCRVRSGGSTSWCPLRRRSPASTPLDALLTGNWSALASASSHLLLPVFTLVFIYMPLVLKNARSAMEDMLGSEFVVYARAAGLPRLMQWRYALRNAMPPIITVTGILTWFLLGGAVLVETVFAWGGLGQYAVQSVVNSDYAALQGVVLLSAVFTMVVFLLVDLAYFVVDPRIK